MSEVQKKALVAMSGGVDSSVAVLLMKEAGYSPIGVTMMLHDQDIASTAGTHLCCTPDDIEDARTVASSLGVPFYVVNFMEGFREKIIDKFIDTYLEGHTPNPCIDCNRYMKFGRLFEMADREGCEKVVTGHYAQIEYDEAKGIYKLKRAVDQTKDQTYVLYFLSQQQLAKLEFPLGKYEKTSAREIAAEGGLIVADKHDSQDICFVPDRDYAGYIDREASGKISEILKKAEMLCKNSTNIDNEEAGFGCFVDTKGNILGKNKGYYHYTIGQRKGLGISYTEPLYVIDIIPEKNQVILGSNEELFTRRVDAVDFNLIYTPDALVSVEELDKSDDELQQCLEPGDRVFRVTGKVRYRAKDTAGFLLLHENGNVTMVFDDAVRASTPGQSLVVYDGDYCLGGGIIVKGG